MKTFLTFIFMVFSIETWAQLIVGNVENISFVNDSVKITAGMLLSENSKIKVPSNSTVTLVNNNVNEFRIKPGSEIFIKNLKDTINLEILKGEIWANINNKNKTIQISNKIVSAIDKGTIFRVNYDNNATVKVYKGNVELKNNITGAVNVLDEGKLIEISSIGIVQKQGEIDLNDPDENSPWAKYNKKKDEILAKKVGNVEQNLKEEQVQEQSKENGDKVNVQTKSISSDSVKGEGEKEEPKAAKGEEEKIETEKATSSMPSASSQSQDKFTMGADYSMVTINDKQYQRIALRPEIPIWRFGIALDIELFIDDSGNISSYGWDFSSGQKTLETLFRKIYYIRFNHPEDPFYFRLGAIDNFTLGYGIAMAGFNNVQLYPGVKELGLVLTLNDISPFKLGLQTMINDLAQVKDKKFIYAARLGFAPLATVQVPIVNNIRLSGFIAGDMNVYAGLRDNDGDGVPNELDAKPEDKNWAIEPTLENWQQELNEIIQLKAEQNNLPDSITNKLILTKSDIDTIEKIKNEKYVANYKGLEDKFAIIGFDLGLPLVKSKVFNLDIYGQFARNYDYDNDNNKVEGYGIGAPGLMASFLIFNLQAEFRHYVGYFQSNYFNSLYEVNRVWVDKSQNSIELKQYHLDSLKINGFYSALTAGLFGFVNGIAGYEYGAGRVNGEETNYQKLYAEASLGEKFIDLIPKLSAAKAFWGKDKFIPDEEDLLQHTVDTKYGYIVGVELSGGVVFQYQTLYYFVQDGPSRTDVVKKKQQYVGISAKF